MASWVTEMGSAKILKKLRRRVLPNIRYLPMSSIRRCGACERLTIIAALGLGDEYRVCIRCLANLRYEMLACYVRKSCPNLEQMDVLELDYQSPLRVILQRARTYTPSFYRENVVPGERREDGTVCQDITSLAMPDESLDLIVSSDVLEHVSDFGAALRESGRVLRSGGAHVFTVPPRPSTRQRARLVGGSIEHMFEPEFHLDPLSPDGVLVFWDLGSDMGDYFRADTDQAGVALRRVMGPLGKDERTVWEARKL